MVGPTPRIAVCGVSHDFGAVSALADVNVTVNERRLAVVGANGSGKSTFARLLNGLVIPSAGSVRIDGLDTRADLAAVRARVGFVFQNPDHQIVYPRVIEDVAFGLRYRNVPRAEQAARALAALDGLGLGPLADRSAHQLSGGEKQLVALAGVLVLEPSFLVLDEPTTLLDLRNRNRVLRILDSLPQAQILITHDLDLAARADRVLVFEAGRLVADDRPAPALAHYRSLMGG